MIKRVCLKEINKAKSERERKKSSHNYYRVSLNDTLFLQLQPFSIEIFIILNISSRKVIKL